MKSKMHSTLIFDIYTKTRFKKALSLFISNPIGGYVSSGGILARATTDR